MQIPFSKRGGSGMKLNFEVVGGTSQPESPKENTIWVNTDQEITEWKIRSTAPDAPIDGMVWFETAISGYTEISVISDPSIHINPSRCKQYVTDAWIDKKAMTYKDGEWHEWVTYLYRRGDTCDAITGGWRSRGLKYQSSALAEAPDFALNADHIYGYIDKNGDAGNSGIISTANSIDLTSYDLLVFDVDYYKGAYYSWSYLTALPSGETVYDRNWHAADATMPRNSDEHSGTYIIDISKLSGEYEVGIFLANPASDTSTTTIRVGNIYLI